MSVTIYILNLDERPDRLKLILSQIPPKLKVVRIGDKKHPTSANIGVRESHLRALNAIQQQPRNTYGIIFEDDVILQSDFFKNITSMISEFRKRCDMILLGATTVIPQRGNHKNQITIPISRFVGCWAYLISPNGASKLYNGLIMMSSNTYVNFDMADCCDGHGAISINARIAVPFLAHCRPDQQSDVRGGPVDDSESIKLVENELLKLI